MPPRSGAPPQITFCLEYPASNRPASLPPPGRQVPGSERSKAPIRRIDEPANRRRPQFPTRAPPRSESHGACRPHPPRKAVRLEPSCFELFSLEPSRSNLRQGGRCRAASAARRLFGGTTSLQTAAAPVSDESAAAQRVARCLPPASASNTPPPRTVRPLFILHAPSHTAAPFHSSRRTAASPSAGWPRAHPPP